MSFDRASKKPDIPNVGHSEYPLTIKKRHRPVCTLVQLATNTVAIIIIYVTKLAVLDRRCPVPQKCVNHPIYPCCCFKLSLSRVPFLGPKPPSYVGGISAACRDCFFLTMGSLIPTSRATWLTGNREFPPHRLRSDPDSNLRPL